MTMKLHPVFEASFQSAREAGRAALSDGQPADARRLVEEGGKLLGEGPQMRWVSDSAIACPDRNIPVRVYRPDSEVDGLIVYLHGGGWVAGSVQGFDGLCRYLAEKSKCTVVSVEYRLAPEYPYPAALNDAVDAISWAYHERARLAKSDARVVVAGDSAGGNLAIVSGLKLRGVVPLALQALFYPVTDCSFDTPSYLEGTDGAGLTRDDMRWFFKHYAMDDSWQDPGISPLRDDVSGSPPTWIGLAAHDVLRSEGERFAKKLEDVGVDVTCTTFERLPHGFARWFNLVDDARAAINEVAAAMNAAVIRRP